MPRSSVNKINQPFTLSIGPFQTSGPVALSVLLRPASSASSFPSSLNNPKFPFVCSQTILPVYCHSQHARLFHFPNNSLLAQNHGAIR